MIGRGRNTMPDGRPDPAHWVIEIRIEKREEDGRKNPGSAIPGNLRVRNGDDITWFVSERVPPALRSSPPEEDPFPVTARRLRNVTLILTLKKSPNPNPFGEKGAPLVSPKDGQITRRVAIQPPPPGKELLYHYGVEVREDEKVILQDVHCPEIIIQR
jgi:hypothetical protein